MMAQMDNVLLINQKERQCGVYQYGFRTGKILKKSTVYNFLYCEIDGHAHPPDSEAELMNLAAQYRPKAIIYNYHPSTMAWLGRDLMNRLPGIVHYGMHHEGSESGLFDYYIYLDSTFSDTDRRFSVPRPLLEDVSLTYQSNPVPIISSFGFGFGNKGFGMVVKTVNDQFDKAIVRLHISRAFYGDRNGESSAGVFPGCRAEAKKPGIELVITDNFLSDEEVLAFMASSTLNAFFYDEMAPSRGLSSVIDYALSVKVPIAISTCCMFRHITSPSICYTNRSLPEIIAAGSEPLQQYRNLWSNANLIRKYEQIVGGR